MMSWDNLEYFCLSVNYTKSGSKEVYNRIAGVGLRPQPYLEKQHLAGQRRIYRQLHEMESEQRRVWAHSLG